ncbi:alpha amylase family protein [Thermophagus sp. OGC60D27]|uniref:alpha amylase family protein n=1 Tax=Thermophagus sp. OGC60D27 TaxID=3458415 RepID=UPI004037726E
MKRMLVLNIVLVSFFIVSCVSSKKQDEPDKHIYMWFDCEANYERLSYPDSIKYYLKKVKDIGVTDVVVDVKSIMGETLYDSDIASFMGEWHGVKRNRDYDMINLFIKEGKKIGLGVHASMNVFSGGHNFYNRGIIYGEHSDWQSINYWCDSIVPISEMKWHYNGMLNPALPEVQDYQLSIIEELVRKYPKLDGLILDRVRYDGITSDFSDFSRKAFEAYAGIKVENFPADILFWEKNDEGNYEWKRGKLFNKWIEWRTSIIYHFFEKARTVTKSANPDILFGTYTGAWYPVYYELGVNWASKKYDPSIDYDWATENYKNYGYAELLDLYMTGLYFYEVTIEEVEKLNEVSAEKRGEAAMGKGKDYWYSVEGSAQLANKVIKDVVPVTGSLYVEQYEKNSEQFSKAVQMAYQSTDGLMIFDIVHIINKDWWEVLEKALSKAKQEN